MRSRIAALTRSCITTPQGLTAPTRHTPRLRGCVPPPSFHRFPFRSMSTTPPRMTSPRFSAGADPAEAEKALVPLLTSGGGRWTLAGDGEGLERTFKFKTFAKTWDFMTAVSLQCKLKNHHPEWSNVFNTTFIRWTTHNPKGLSSKDLDLATICDALARDFGEVVEESPSCELSNLADRAVSSSGDCCTPRK